MVATQKGQAKKLYRGKDGLGLWEHRGRVAAISFGVSPIDRRWDEKLEHSLGAYSMIAATKAIDDAGIESGEIDGVVSAPGPLGPMWKGPYFDPPYDSEDGISMVTAEWLSRNMQLQNVKWVNSEPRDIAQALAVAAQALGQGLCTTCLVVCAMGNLQGRYRHKSATHVKEDAVWREPWAWTPITQTAYRFQQYCLKYNTNHDRMAPFVVNLRRNGRMSPNSYYYQHPEPPLTIEEYLNSRWVCKPMVIHDADRPVNAATCFVMTNSRKARSMKQKPVYILNHNYSKFDIRSTIETLEESETFCEIHARRMYEGSGLTPDQVDVFNPYDGYPLFTQHYLEAFKWHGVKKGEAHDFYAGDISVEGPYPLCSSGGNNGNGRYRSMIFTDCIEQLQGRAGERQVRVKAETAIAGLTLPAGSAWLAFSVSPD